MDNVTVCENKFQDIHLRGDEIYPRLSEELGTPLLKSTDIIPLLDLFLSALFFV